MSDGQATASNNRDEKHVRPQVAVTHQPQPVLVSQIGYTIPMIRSNGRAMSNTTFVQSISVREYRAWSIFNMFFCCFFLGVAACAKSRETKEKKRLGDVQGALYASGLAKTFNICATILGTISTTVFIALSATNTVQFFSYHT